MLCESPLRMNRAALTTTTLVICLGLVACAEPIPDQDNLAPVEVVAAPTVEQMRLWANNCALCHVNGEGGAPRVAIHNDWANRNEQGKQVLLQHTIEGFNNMPPLGYCMACEEDDLVALINFMAGEAP